MLLQEPALAPPFARFLHALARRQQVFVVGGFLRDALLGLPPSDADFATDAPPEAIKALVEAHGLKIFADKVAAVHGTWRMTTGRPYEVLDLARLRKDVARLGVRHATVAFTDDIKEDLARRDLTINGLAMAYPFAGEASRASASGALGSAKTAQLIDCFAGQTDLRQRRLRLIGEARMRLAEDPLRALRVLRFACRGRAWRIAEATWRAICTSAPAVADVSFERMRAEWQKSLAMPVPSRFVTLAAEAGLMAVLWPGRAPWFHLPAAAEALTAAESRVEGADIRLLAWAVGGVAPRRRALPANQAQGPRRQAARAAHVASGMRRLRFARAEVERAETLCRLFPFQPQRLRGRALAAWLIELGAQAWRDVEAVGPLWVAARRANKKEFRALLRRARKLLGDNAAAAFQRNHLALNGEDLLRDKHLTAGPLLGRVLFELHVYALEHGCFADRERLLGVALRRIAEDSPGKAVV